MPRTLFEIGASLTVFLRKHRGPDNALAAHRAAQERRLFQHLQTGLAEPRDVRNLMKTFDDGVADGQSRPFGEESNLSVSEVFEPICPDNGESKVLAGRIWQAAGLRRRAARLAEEGHIVTLFLFGPSTRYHRVRFTPDGIWEQSGGLWGRSVRSDPLIQLASFRSRVAMETNRVADQRLISR